MSVHSDGLGSSWNETLDIDQPHGLDYREWNDVRVGTRKRMAQEHSSFADATVGGIHKPGGSAILGMQDATPAADGTLVGHGIVWDLSEVLYCSTATAGASTTGDWTVMLLHPDKQWKGGDITWTGAAQFDNSVEFLDPVDFTGPCRFDSSVRFDATAVDFQGDVSIVEHLACGSSVEIASDLSVDGTTVVSDTVITGEATFTFDAAGDTTAMPTIRLFGDWSGRVVETTYTTVTDGLVMFMAEATNADITISIQTPHGTDRVMTSVCSDGWGGLTCPVKAGDTWAVRADPTNRIQLTDSKVYFLPIGDNTA